MCIIKCMQKIYCTPFTFYCKRTKFKKEHSTKIIKTCITPLSLVVSLYCQVYKFRNDTSYGSSDYIESTSQKGVKGTKLYI